MSSAALEWRLLLMLCMCAHVHGHGAMIMPPPRNAIDSTIPGFDWGNGSTRTGHLEPLSVRCANGTGTCRPGQSVFWFSQGCTPGCDECDGQGQRIPNWDHCAAMRKEPFKPTLAKKCEFVVRTTRQQEPDTHVRLWPRRLVREPQRYRGHAAGHMEVSALAKPWHGARDRPLWDGGRQPHTNVQRRGIHGHPVREAGRSGQPCAKAKALGYRLGCGWCGERVLVHCVQPRRRVQVSAVPRRRGSHRSMLPAAREPVRTKIVRTLASAALRPLASAALRPRGVPAHKQAQRPAHADAARSPRLGTGWNSRATTTWCSSKMAQRRSRTPWCAREAVRGGCSRPSPCQTSSAPTATISGASLATAAPAAVATPVSTHPAPPRRDATCLSSFCLAPFRGTHHAAFCSPSPASCPRQRPSQAHIVTIASCRPIADPPPRRTGGNTPDAFPNPFGKDNAGKNTAIMDSVRVPSTPGEYVLGFRWDCETSSQVWSTCADVTIV